MTQAIEIVEYEMNKAIPKKYNNRIYQAIEEIKTGYSTVYRNGR